MDTSRRKKRQGVLSRGAEHPEQGRMMRVEEFCLRSGYRESSIRKKIYRRELGYMKVGRMILIPEAELKRIMGTYMPPINAVGE